MELPLESGLFQQEPEVFPNAATLDAFFKKENVFAGAGFVTAP